MTMTTEQTPVSATSEPAAVKAPEAPSAATPRTPFVAAAKVVASVQLAAIHFSACSAQALEAARAIPDDAALSASTRFLRPTVAPLDSGFSTTTSLMFQVGAKLPDAQETTPYAIIRATIEARYTLKPGTAPFSDDELKDYALCYCPFHVWGYWREFVQSSLARLDLPQLTVPLFLISQAPDMVQEKLE